MTCFVTKALRSFSTRKFSSLCLSMACAFLGVIGVTSTASAATSGKVIQIRNHAAGIGSNWFLLDTGLSFTGCAHYPDAATGNAIFLIEDNERGKQIASMVMAAMLSGKTITVADAVPATGSSFCIARVVDIT